MENLIDRPVSALSPNQLYLLEFAKALIQKPKVLVVDEITSALFRDDVRIVKSILDELKNQGCIILFISHRMNEIYTICDSVSVMRNGEVIGTYKIDEKTETELLSMMVGKNVQNDAETGSAACPTDNAHDESILRLTHFSVPGFNTFIDLDIKKGEIVGIAGLQGHGQSQLTRSILGLYGEISFELDGKPVIINSPASSVTKGIAFISGDRIKEGAFLERSVSENTWLLRTLYLIEKKPIRVLF